MNRKMNKPIAGSSALQIFEEVNVQVYLHGRSNESTGRISERRIQKEKDKTRKERNSVGKHKHAT